MLLFQQLVKSWFYNLKVATCILLKSNWSCCAIDRVVNVGGSSEKDVFAIDIWADTTNPTR